MHDNHVVDLASAELDETGLIKTTKQHVGPNHSIVPLVDLDRWSIGDVSILANIFQKAVDANPHTDSKLNKARDSLVLAPPTKTQWVHLKETYQKQLHALANGKKSLDERHIKLNTAIEKQMEKRNQIEREKDTLESEGSQTYIRLTAMREARKFFGNK